VTEVAKPIYWVDFGGPGTGDECREMPWPGPRKEAIKPAVGPGQSLPLLG